MLTVLTVIGVVFVLFGAAVVATRGDSALLQPAPADAADVLMPSTADEVRQVRFAMAPRGYRMSEVDQVLERLAEELAARDARIDELSGASVEEPPSRAAL